MIVFGTKFLPSPPIPTPLLRFLFLKTSAFRDDFVFSPQSRCIFIMATYRCVLDSWNRIRFLPLLDVSSFYFNRAVSALMHRVNAVVDAPLSWHIREYRGFALACFSVSRELEVLRREKNVQYERCFLGNSHDGRRSLWKVSSSRKISNELWNLSFCVLKICTQGVGRLSLTQSLIASTRGDTKLISCASFAALCDLYT